MHSLENNLSGQLKQRRHIPDVGASHAFYGFLLKRTANAGQNRLGETDRLAIDRAQIRGTAIMTAQDRATVCDAAQPADRNDRQIRHRTASPGAMALQSGRGYEAAPQALVRLSGSHLVKPRISRDPVTE